MSAGMMVKTLRQTQAWWWVAYLLKTSALIVMWVAVSPFLIMVLELWRASDSQSQHALLLSLGLMVIVMRRMKVAYRRYRTPSGVLSTVSGSVLIAEHHLRTTDELKQTARHEAAHMVVAMALGCSPISASVCRTENRLGEVWIRNPDEGTISDKALINMAWGLAGQIIDHREGSPDGGACSDIEQVMRQAAIIISVGEAPSGYTADLRFDDLLNAARDLSTTVIEMNTSALDDLSQRLSDTQGRTGLYEQDLKDLNVVPYYTGLPVGQAAHEGETHAPQSTRHQPVPAEK